MESLCFINMISGSPDRELYYGFKDGDYQKRILNIYDYNYYYGSKIESGEVAIEKGGQL